MNLRTATPLQIDTIIADLERQAWAQAARRASAFTALHHAVGDGQTRRFGWKMTDQEVLDQVERLRADGRSDFIKFNHSTEAAVNANLKVIAAAEAEQSRLQEEIDTYEAEFERRPWARFFQLRSTGGARIHSTRLCQGLHRSDPGDLGWHPELSGKTEAEVIAPPPQGLGPVMCSKCFRSAPVEWRQDPKTLRPVDPDACDGEGEDPIEGTVTRFSNWSGVKYYGDCPVCEANKLLKSGNKLPRHKKPKDK